MSSGHEARRDGKLDIRREKSNGEHTSDLPPDVLAEIVAETAAQLATAEPTDPAVNAAIINVARQYSGQSMTAEPVGAAMLAAMLTIQFPFLAHRPQLLARASKTVAHTLLADLTARRRLEHLWAKLMEEVA
jgi:hypothetical protein